MGMLKLGTVALDGTKIQAKARRHSALSYEHATKIEAQLKAEGAELLAKAEAADRAGIPPRRVEPRDFGLEHEADVRPEPRQVRSGRHPTAETRAGRRSVEPVPRRQARDQSPSGLSGVIARHARPQARVRQAARNT